MRIIDFRCRPPFGNFVKDWIFRLEDQPGNPGLRSKYTRMDMDLPGSLLSHSMADFADEMGKENICLAVVPVRQLPTLGNDDLVELLNTYPASFAGMAGVQPLKDGAERTVAQIATYVLNGPCFGVYMEPGLDPQPWHVDDPLCLPVFEFCEKNNFARVYALWGRFSQKKSPPV